MYIYITKLENSNQVWKIVFSKTATIKLKVRKGNDYDFCPFRKILLYDI